MSKDILTNIDDLKGSIYYYMAEKADANGDRVIDKYENSIFTKIKKSYNPRNQTFEFDGKVYNASGKEYNPADIKSEVPDALRTSNLEKSPDAMMAQDKKVAALNKSNSSKYKITDDPKYAEIEKVVIRQILKRTKFSVKDKNGKFVKKVIQDINNVPAEKRQKILNQAQKTTLSIAPMIVDLCKKYRIYDLAPIIADILGNETGGYDFSPKSMDPSGKKYKGVMQVDFENCQVIFNEGGIVNRRWHKDHFSQDDSRIKELKIKYKTAKNLYNAMKTDVKLGLEVGIIAYKAKLHEAKGNTRKAIALYCGSGCSYPFNNVPTEFKVS